MSLPLSDATDATVESKVEKTDPLQNTDQVEQSSSSPPSSPPVLKEESTQKGHSSPSKKRPPEEMASGSENAVDSSIPGQVYSTAPEGKSTVKEPESSTTNIPSVNAHSMPPPAIPGAVKKKASSGDSSQKSQSQAEEPQKASQPSSETLKTSSGVGDSKGSDNESRSLSVRGDPNDQIEDFDWDSLEGRYHDRMKELAAEQHAIMDEFDGLCHYFGGWAQAGSRREIDRSFKRLKTQETLVQYHEDQLEEKRVHYIKVVDAFKSALQLLQN